MQLSRTHAACLSATLAAFLYCSCASHQSTGSQRVRQRFVPSTTNSASANWTALAPFPHAFGDPQVMAHAGIGNTFPVQEPGSPILFNVVVLAGDDNHLDLEIRPPGSDAKKITLKREKTTKVPLGSKTFEISYPAVHVSSGDPPTTSKVLMIIRQCP